MAETIISREEARAQGLKHYFTGEPCRNGHVADRLVSNKLCRECRSSVWNAFTKRNPQRVLANRAKQNERLTASGYFQEYYSRNAEKRKTQTRVWYEANRERAWDAMQAWRERNPERSRAIQQACSHRRRAREASAPGSHTASDLQILFVRQHGKCAICKGLFAELGSELDHIVPLARGGSNDPSNLQYLCRPCNRAKHAKDPIEFAQERGLLL